MSSSVKGALGAAAAVLVVLVAFAWIGVPSFLNPFETETTETDRAAVLDSLEDLSEYHAATGTYQVVIEVEDETRFIPRSISGEKTTFLAQGSVDALVDLSSLGVDAVTISDDGESVRVTLPPAVLDEAVIDHEKSGVMGRERGLLDRAAGFFSDNPTSEMDLLVRAEEKLEAAAAEGELRERAEENTEAVVEGLLGQLGFDDVEVVFAQDPQTAGST